MKYDYITPIGTYTFLAENDELKASDLIRPLVYTEFPFFERHQMQWVTVDTEIPAWIGQTLLDLYKFRVTDDVIADWPYEAEYEVMRKV